MEVTEEQKRAGLAWIKKFHSTGDSLDFKPFVYDFFTEDAELTFGGNPMVKGIDAVYEVFKHQKPFLGSMKHVVGHVDVMPDRIYQEAMIYYKVHGDPSGDEIEVTGFAVYHKRPEDDKMHRFDVYGNFDKLQKRIADVNGSA